MLEWGRALDGFRPDRWDLLGAPIALGGVLLIFLRAARLIAHPAVAVPRAGKAICSPLLQRRHALLQREALAA